MSSSYKSNTSGDNRKGCVSFTFDLGAVVAALVASVGGIFFTSQFVQRQQPTSIPTDVASVVVVTPKPVIVTATPSADQQDPLPGSIILTGMGYKKGGIAVRVENPIDFGNNDFELNIMIENNSNDQILVRWKNSSVHAQDDTGRVYHQNNENASFWNETKQFAISAGGKREIVWCCSPDSPDHLDFFVGRIESSVKYSIVTKDQLAGLANMKWRYDLLGSN